MGLRIWAWSRKSSRQAWAPSSGCGQQHPAQEMLLRSGFLGANKPRHWRHMHQNIKDLYSTKKDAALAYAATTKAKSSQFLCSALRGCAGPPQKEELAHEARIQLQAQSGRCASRKMPKSHYFRTPPAVSMCRVDAHKWPCTRKNSHAGRGLPCLVAKVESPQVPRALHASADQEAGYRSGLGGALLPACIPCVHRGPVKDFRSRGQVHRDDFPFPCSVQLWQCCPVPSWSHPGRDGRCLKKDGFPCTSV